MKKLWMTALATAAAVGSLTFAGGAQAKDLLGVACSKPQPARCDGEQCNTSGALANLGNAADVNGRKFFLDYPCDLKPNEKVTVILNLHGAGSIGNWQRHYFPAADYVDKYRLVVITPTAATSPARGPMGPGVRVWVGEADDAHLQAITDAVVGALGKQRIRNFWLAGHSQGGMTSSRIVCTPFFADKVDGLLSLSGGRVGGVSMNPRFGPPKADGSPPDARNVTMGAPKLPTCQFSHIYTTGEHEITELPEASAWAAELGCGPRVRRADIVDTKAGHVWDYDRAGYKVWGMKAGPGATEEFDFPKCKGGRVVADFVRKDKGHTEGLEPKVTEAIVKMMAGASGSKIANGG
jgi:pimeloyl-ACP methyl ester carboxylesterase